MTRRHLVWIDWMKATGMSLILIGHLAARWNNGQAPPIYPKQLGVTFFLFATGFTLAGETRSSARVLFNRLAEIFLYGLGLAAIIAVKGLILDGDAHLFNFLPFVFGVNVVFDHFPPNPTTWYIGTYIQILVLWAVLLRGVRVTPAGLLAALGLEIVIRSLLMDHAGLHIAYMLLTNWMTVFLLGFFSGQQADEAEARAGLDWSAAVLVPILVVWPWVVGQATIARSFPFSRVANNAFVTSASISFIYIAYTWAAYRIARRLPEVNVVRFIARNTLVIFLAHMPLYFAVNPLLRRLVDSYNARAVILLIASTAGLGYASELLHRLGIGRSTQPSATNAAAAAINIAAAAVPSSASRRFTRSL
jgi:peptidoglycan/LPS O-acetylase OafA/YrhL